MGCCVSAYFLTNLFKNAKTIRLLFFLILKTDFDFFNNYLSKWEATLYHKIVFRNVGVGKKKDTLKFKANVAGSSISLDGSKDVVDEMNWVQDMINKDVKAKSLKIQIQ